MGICSVHDIRQNDAKECCYWEEMQVSNQIKPTEVADAVITNNWVRIALGPLAMVHAAAEDSQYLIMIEPCLLIA